MNTNAINSAYSSVDTSTYKSTSAKASRSEKANTKTEADATKSSEASSSKTQTEGVVYESSNIKNMSKADRQALVEKLKADVEARTSQLRSLVEDMFLKQGQKVNNSNDMWKFLASGNFTVDKSTAEAAKEAISEDGYWGVKQTSQRIFDMAVALSGGDEKNMDKMLNAFKKGFKQATAAWGKELPDISQKTYGAVLEKFENYKNEKAAANVEA